MIQKTRLTSKSSRIGYYAASALTLAAGLRPSLRVFRMLLAGAGRQARLVSLRGSPARFLVRSRMDLWMLKEVCLDRDYERVGAPLENGWVVMDVGAGIGEFSIEAATRFPDAAFHAFEPSPSAFSLLCDNIALNGTGSVRAYPIALSSKAGSGRLDISTGATAFHRLADAAESHGDSGTVVSAWSLDDAMLNCGIARCDFLKMDCEGGEYDALLTTSSATFARIQRICLEYHDSVAHHHRELVSMLAAEGYRVRLTGNPAYEELGFLYAWKT